MAEFCLECLNKYIMREGDQLTEEDVTVYMDLCEGCGEIKPCVVKIKKMKNILEKNRKKYHKKKD